MEIFGTLLGVNLLNHNILYHSRNKQTEKQVREILCVLNPLEKSTSLTFVLRVSKKNNQ